MRRILEVLAAVFIIGGFVFLLGTAGSSDCDLLTFSQILCRGLLAVMIMGTGVVIAMLLEWIEAVKHCSSNERK